MMESCKPMGTIESEASRALCKAAAIESRLEEQDEVSKRVKEANKNEHKIEEGN